MVLLSLYVRACVYVCGQDESRNRSLEMEEPSLKEGGRTATPSSPPDAVTTFHKWLAPPPASCSPSPLPGHLLTWLTHSLLFLTPTPTPILASRLGGLLAPPPLCHPCWDCSTHLSCFTHTAGGDPGTPSPIPLLCRAPGRYACGSVGNISPMCLSPSPPQIRKLYQCTHMLFS